MDDSNRVDSTRRRQPLDGRAVPGPKSCRPAQRSGGALCAASAPGGGSAPRKMSGRPDCCSRVELVAGIGRSAVAPSFAAARHKYRKGDLLIVDDRASLHEAGFDFDPAQQRRPYRLLVRGDRPF